MKYKQIDIENLRKIGYLEENDTVESLEELVNENIENWRELEKTNMNKVSLGYYYVCFLLVRDSLQIIIENTNEEVKEEIKSRILVTDYFFKKNMKPKPYHYEWDRELLIEEKYFWDTHTIHPIDQTIKITSGFICEDSEEKLNKIEGSWRVLEMTYSEKIAKEVLLDYRESQIVNPHLKIEYFMWRFLGHGVKRKNYTKEKIDNLLNDNPSVEFIKRLLFGIIAQFTDLGKLCQKTKGWSLKCLEYLENDLSENYDIIGLRKIILKLN